MVLVVIGQKTQVVVAKHDARRKHVRYHSIIRSNCPVRSTKWANFAGLIGAAAGSRVRIGAISFITSSLFRGRPGCRLARKI